MTQPSREKTARADMMAAEVARLYNLGGSIKEIALRLDVDRDTVSGYLKSLRKAWREVAKRHFGDRQDRELAILDEVESAAWDGWKASRKDAVKTKEGMHGKTEIRETITHGQAGDPRFLATVQKCVERRCAILGLDAPKKIEPTGLPAYSREKMKEIIMERIKKLREESEANQRRIEGTG